MSVPSIPMLLQATVVVDGERFHGVYETSMHACPRVGEQVVVLPFTHPCVLVADVRRVLHLIGGRPLVLLDDVEGTTDHLDALTVAGWEVVHAQTDGDDFLSALVDD